MLAGYVGQLTTLSKDMEDDPKSNFFEAFQKTVTAAALMEYQLPIGTFSPMLVWIIFGIMLAP